MPSYDYECKKCNKINTVIHSIKDKLKNCQYCKSTRVNQVFISRSPPVIFKGDFMSNENKYNGKKKNNLD